jgi:hypothetical protein
MVNKKRWYEELEKARIWISEFLRDFGIALIAGSSMASAIDYRYWYSLIFGLLFLYTSLSFKFGKRVRVTKKEFEEKLKHIDYMVLTITFSMIVIGVILFFFQPQSLVYFSIFFGVWIWVVRKSIYSAITRIIKWKE